MCRASLWLSCFFLLEVAFIICDTALFFWKSFFFGMIKHEDWVNIVTVWLDQLLQGTQFCTELHHLRLHFFSVVPKTRRFFLLFQVSTTFECFLLRLIPWRLVKAFVRRPLAAKASSTTCTVDVRFGFVKMAFKLAKLRQDTPACASFLENLHWNDVQTLIVYIFYLT